jgi:hypothetical protein
MIGWRPKVWYIVRNAEQKMKMMQPFVKAVGRHSLVQDRSLTNNGINDARSNVLVEKAVVDGQYSGESLLSLLVLRFCLK